MVFTLGIGTAWALCRIHRWRCENTYFQGKALKFYGNGGELFGKMFKWWILSNITLGIYLFWAIPKYYKWLTESTHYAELSANPGGGPPPGIIPPKKEAEPTLAHDLA